jgi:hypothetical protein
MKENKNHLSEKAATLAYNLIMAATEMRPSVTTTEKSIMASIPHMDENSKLNRRYSFDDNGGGYAGL